MRLNPNITAVFKLPLIFIIDSILQNTRGQYIPLIEIIAPEWIYVTFNMMEDKKVKIGELQRVVFSWRDFNIFQPKLKKNLS
jgi:CID domain